MAASLCELSDCAVSFVSLLSAYGLHHHTYLSKHISGRCKPRRHGADVNVHVLRSTCECLDCSFLFPPAVGDDNSKTVLWREINAEENRRTFYSVQR